MGKGSKDNMIERLYILDKALRMGGGTLAELAEKAKVSTKTARRDITELQWLGSDAEYRDERWVSTVAAFRIVEEEATKGK